MAAAARAMETGGCGGAGGGAGGRVARHSRSYSHVSRPRWTACTAAASPTAGTLEAPPDVATEGAARVAADAIWRYVKAHAARCQASAAERATACDAAEIALLQCS